MPKKLEIERKYLLKRLPSVDYQKTLRIIQMYTDDARLRQITDLKNGKKQWILTKKKKLGAGIYEEDEKNISHEEYVELALTAKTSINKTRYIYKHGKFKFEIDVYEMKLVTAEIELPKVDTKFTIPHEIQKEIIMDVTEFPQFTNKSLSDKI